MVRIVHTVCDITDHKQAEEEKRALRSALQRAERMEALGILAGGVAHDLNNVLGVLFVYTELLLEKIPEGSPLRTYVENILSSGEKSAAIIQDLLTLARRGVMVQEVVNVNGIVSGFFKTPVFERIETHHPRVDLQEGTVRGAVEYQGIAGPSGKDGDEPVIECGGGDFREWRDHHSDGEPVSRQAGSRLRYGEGRGVCGADRIGYGQEVFRRPTSERSLSRSIRRR